MSAPYDHLLSHLSSVRKVQSPAQSVVRAHRATCPSCDKKLKLSLGETADGTVLLHCHRGCGTADVLDALGMHVRDLFPGSGEHSSPSRRLRSIGQWRSGAAIADAIHTHAALLLSDDLSDDEMLYLSHRITTSADQLQAMHWSVAGVIAAEIAHKARWLLACSDDRGRWLIVQEIGLLSRVLDKAVKAEARAARARASARGAEVAA